jgi:hypothetical protein
VTPHREWFKAGDVIVHQHQGQHEDIGQDEFAIVIGDYDASVYVGTLAEMQAFVVRLAVVVSRLALPERRRCPDCETVLDEDGYCVDVGCPNLGKAS